MVNLVCAIKLRPDNYVCSCSLLAQFLEVLELVHIPRADVLMCGLLNQCWCYVTSILITYSCWSTLVSSAPVIQ